MPKSPGRAVRGFLTRVQPLRLALGGWGCAPAPTPVQFPSITSPVFVPCRSKATVRRGRISVSQRRHPLAWRWSRTGCAAGRRRSGPERLVRPRRPRSWLWRPGCRRAPRATGPGGCMLPCCAPYWSLLVFRRQDPRSGLPRAHSRWPPRPRAGVGGAGSRRWRVRPPSKFWGRGLGLMPRWFPPPPPGGPLRCDLAPQRWAPPPDLLLSPAPSPSQLRAPPWRPPVPRLPLPLAPSRYPPLWCGRCRLLPPSPPRPPRSQFRRRLLSPGRWW